MSFSAPFSREELRQQHSLIYFVAAQTAKVFGSGQRKGILFVFAVAAILAAKAGAQGQVTPPDFTIIVLPDTQNEADKFPAMMNSQTQWIVDNQKQLNIQMVLGVGDIVNDGASDRQQGNADAAIKLLDNASIPYMLAIGNHDYNGANTGAKTRTATGFNKWWGPQRYAGRDFYKGNEPGGTFPQGSNENFYGILNINNKPVLFLVLEYVPRSQALDWASGIISKNPDKDVIVVTHSHLYFDNTRVDRCDTADLLADNDGEESWNGWLRRFPNVHLILSGHITTGMAARRADLGSGGNLVNALYADYQDLKAPGTTTSAGNGWLRIMTFHPLTNTITVRTFSPFLNSEDFADKNNFTIFFHSPGSTASSPGNLSGRVRADRGSIYGSPCRIIGGATVRNSNGTSTVSTSDGKYSFTGLAQASYSLSASAPGWITSSSQSAKVWGTYTTDLNFYLKPLLGSVAGTVVDSSGHPIAGAHVQFVGGTIATNLAKVASSTGQYSSGGISIGTYTVTASDSGHTASSKSVTVTTGTTKQLNFTLH